MKRILSEPITGNPVFAYCRLLKGDMLLAEKRMVYDQHDSDELIFLRMKLGKGARPDRMEIDIIHQW